MKYNVIASFFQILKVLLNYEMLCIIQLQYIFHTQTFCFCLQIGRASDVWSLGCILYVMAYRKTPFQHISNHMQKWQCIMDPTYEIKFPRIENHADLVDTMKVNICFLHALRRLLTFPSMLVRMLRFIFGPHFPFNVYSFVST